MSRGMSRSAASAAAMMAVTTRVFYGLMVDAGDLHNGAWLSALIGAALALPVLWLARRARMRLNSGALVLRAFHGILALLLVIDAAHALDCTVFSADYVTFEHFTVPMLAVPMAVLALRAIALGGDAIGNAARICIIIFALLMLIIALLQASYLRPGWLTPALGFGVHGIAQYGVRSGSWIALIASAALMQTDGGELPEAKRLARDVALACAVTVALIALRLMFTPSTDAIGLRRAVRLDSLLTNGRAPLYLQLPLTIVWFGGLLNLFCFECWAASACLGAALPRLNRWITGIICVGLVLVLFFLWMDGALPSDGIESKALWILGATSACGAISGAGRGECACGASD